MDIREERDFFHGFASNFPPDCEGVSFMRSFFNWYGDDDDQDDAGDKDAKEYITCGITINLPKDYNWSRVMLSRCCLFDQDDGDRSIAIHGWRSVRYIGKPRPETPCPGATMIVLLSDGTFYASWDDLTLIPFRQSFDSTYDLKPSDTRIANWKGCSSTFNFYEVTIKALSKRGYDMSFVKRVVYADKIEIPLSFFERSARGLFFNRFTEPPTDGIVLELTDGASFVWGQRPPSYYLFPSKLSWIFDSQRPKSPTCRRLDDDAIVDLTCLADLVSGPEQS